MPGFGTTNRTYTNAIELITKMGATLKEISIKEACIQHFKDIEHDPNVRDITYENSQERAKPSTPIVNRNSSIPTKRDPIPSRDSLLNYSHTRESGSLPMQRQSMPVNRQSTSTSIKPRTSIFTRKSDMGMNERKEESAQKRVEELARENARLRNELDKAHVFMIELNKEIG